MTRHLVTFTPTGLTRQERRDLHRQVQQAARSDGPAISARRDRGLPEPVIRGPFGPALVDGGYWNLAAVSVPPHQATSQNIAGIYPFVADAGLPHTGPIIGVDLNADALWHYSPWDAYANTTDRGTMSTNILVLGAYRAGKSATIKTLITRSLAFGHQAVVPSDAKGEWVVVADAIPGGRVIHLGGAHSTRLNPLDRGPRRSGTTDDEHEQMVKQRRLATLVALMEMALGAKLTAVEHAALHHALQKCIIDTGDEPTLRGVHEQLTALTADATGDARLGEGAVQPAYVLRRFVDGDLSGLFEDASTVAFDQDAPIVVVDTSELFARGDLVAQLTQVCTTSWIQAVISDRAAHRTRYLVREEGWRDMRSLPSLQVFQQWLKLSRHYGIANIVILHQMGDLDAVGEADSIERALAYSIVGDIENKFIFRVNQQEQTSLRQRLNLPAPHVEMTRTLRKGQFLAYIGQYAYLVDCFATSTEWEFDLFSTDDALLPADEDAIITVLDPDQLNTAWPSADPTERGIDGWLNPGTASWKEHP